MIPSHTSAQARFKIGQSLGSIRDVIKDQEWGFDIDQPIAIWVHFTKPNGISVSLRNAVGNGSDENILSFEEEGFRSVSEIVREGDTSREKLFL